MHGVSLLQMAHRLSDERLYGLDVLRFSAAVSVFVYHQVITSVRAAETIGFPQTNAFISEIGRYGNIGVHAFFILSGFVIFATALKTDSAGFFISRFVRIMPTFVLCALVSMLAAGPSLGRQEASFALYTSNVAFVPQAFGFEWIDTVFWTLRYEVHFYAFVFLLLITNQLRRMAWPLTWLWLTVAGLQVLGVLPNILRQVLAADFAPLFIIGIGLWWSLEKPTPARVLLVVVATFVAVVGELPRIASNEAGIQLAINRWIMCGLIAVLPFVFLIALRLPLRRVGRLCYFAGGISYPLYLLHNNLSVALMPKLGVYLGVMIIVGGSSIVFLIDEA